jgi:hypothetical protein
MTEITMTRAPSSKSVVRSLRLDEDVDKSLHKLASDEGISVNSLVNRALRRYVVWDANSSRFGGVTLAGASLTRIMNYLSDDEVREYARWIAENSVRDFVTFFFGDVTLHTLLGALKLLGDYGGHFVYEESTVWPRQNCRLETWERNEMVYPLRRMGEPSSRETSGVEG